MIGISPNNTKASTTAYDPTCGSGSLLLKVAAQAGKRITLEGQEKDVTTAGLARMNMILHDFPTANIVSGNTLAAPKFKDGEALRTYDYVVANPPFSDKTWTTGITPSKDPFQRFAWGEPPAKQGDYAYLLHIIRSMKGTGKAACILPHGVLFRGNAEATIRRELVRSGYLKGIIGLPTNLFYGTGIPACILVLDKENAAGRKGAFMVDASKGFKKDGPKNRLREQDIHRIVDVFTKHVDVPRYARLVSVDEIADPKNNFNLNLTRYVDSSEPDDLQDIDGHLRGGIPERDLDALGAYWEVLPSVRGVLFESAGRPGYARLRLPLANVKRSILGHAEFAAFHKNATKEFADWRTATTPRLTAFDRDDHPKALIEIIAEDLLAAFRQTPLLDAYDVYQHLMDYWAETMQDDCYLIAADGWVKGAQPREIVQIKNEDNKLTWPEPHDYLKGKRRFKSDLVPAPTLVARYFTAERYAIEALDDLIATLQQQLDEMHEENNGEEGLLAEVIEGEGDKQKIAAKAVKVRLKEIGKDILYADERMALEAYAALLDQQTETKAKRKAAHEDLDKKIGAKYPKLTEPEIKTMVVDDKWMARLSDAVQGELNRVSQTITERLRELAERYATPLPKLSNDVKTLTTQVDIGVRKPYLGNRAVQWDRINIGDLPTVPMSRADLDKFRLRKGDLLVCEGGEVGRAAIWDAPLDECYYQKALHRLRPLRQFDSRLMVAILRLWSTRGILANYVTQTSIAHLPRQKFVEVPIPRPPPPEQRAIATALSDVDALLGGLDRLVAKKRDLKQGAMQQLLTGQTRLPGFHGGWEMKRLGDYATFLRNGVNSRAELLAEGRVRYLHYGDVHGCKDVYLSPDLLPFLPDTKAASLDRLRDGDLVIADASEDVAGVSKSVEMRGLGISEVVAGLHTIGARFDKTVLADGFKGFLQFCPPFATQLRRLAAGTKVYATHRAHVASVEMRLPMVAEQAAIAAVLSDMDAEVSALEARRDKTRDLKQAIIQELLTGKTRLVTGVEGANA